MGSENLDIANTNLDTVLSTKAAAKSAITDYESSDCKQITLEIKSKLDRWAVEIDQLKAKVDKTVSEDVMDADSNTTLSTFATALNTWKGQMPSRPSNS